MDHGFYDCVKLCFQTSFFLILKLIWKETKSLGCGIKEVRKNGRIETYIVSRYSPRGNSIRRNWGESSSQARIRVYGANVQKRNIGGICVFDLEFSQNFLLFSRISQKSTLQRGTDFSIFRTGPEYRGYFLLFL